MTLKCRRRRAAAHTLTLSLVRERAPSRLKARIILVRELRNPHPTLSLTGREAQKVPRGAFDPSPFIPTDCLFSHRAVQFALTTMFYTLSRMGEGVGPWRAAHFFCAARQNFDAWRQTPAPDAKVPHPRPLPSGRGCKALGQG